MSAGNISQRRLLAVCVVAVSVLGIDWIPAQESRDQLREPVLRIDNRQQPVSPPAQPTPPPQQAPPQEPQHPLDPAIKLAEDTVVRIRTGVNDYTCTIIKQERIKDELMPAETMLAEIRNPKRDAQGNVVQPLSAYLEFKKPEAMAGRQVIYVQGANNDKMIAREGSGLKAKFGWVWLKPDGFLAMQGQRYPITNIGIERLIEQLIERGTRDKRNDPTGELTVVRFIPGAKINNRPCTVLEVTHPQQKPWFDFHIARIFIDDELQLPVRYAAYWWPTRAGEEPRVEEAYTYLDVKLNVGLTDANFDYTKR